MISDYTIRIFVGCPINSALRLQLDRSDAWKAAKITGHGLVENPYNGHTYIGKFVPALPVKLSDIRMLQDEVSDELQRYCPDLDVRKITTAIFSQCFVGA